MSREQIAGFAHILKSGGAPYLDFGVWGPNHHRLLRKMKFKGTRPVRGGGYQEVELLGPPSFQYWEESWELAVSAFVGFDQVDLGVLDTYRAKHQRYSTLYGPEAWGLQYQSDVRCRLEHFDVIHRELHAIYEQGPQDTRAHSGYDPNRPWNAVFQRAAKDFEFWHDEFEQPAAPFLKGLASRPGGDAPVGSVPHAAADDSQPVPPKRDLHRSEQLPRKNPRPTPAQRKHNLDHEGARFTTNRKGRDLCAEFQEGKCESYRNSANCPRNPKLSHQCNRCLDIRHGGHECSQVPKEPPQHAGKGTKPTKGRGKGQPRWR